MACMCQGVLSNRSDGEEFKEENQLRVKNRCRVGDVVQFFTSWHIEVTQCFADGAQQSFTILPAFLIILFQLVSAIRSTEFVLLKRSAYALSPHY